MPDVTGRADRARNWKGNCTEALSLLWKLALNLPLMEGSKGSARDNLKRAGWDGGFLISIRSNSPKSICGRLVPNRQGN